MPATPIIKPEDVQNICDKIDSIPDCTQLVAYATKQFALWEKQMTDMLTAKASAAAKKVAPTDLPSVITWIQNFINEAIKDYNDAMQAIGEVTAAYATITAHITAKAAALTCGAIPIPPLPPIP